MNRKYAGTYAAVHPKNLLDNFLKDVDGKNGKIRISPVGN